MCQNWITEYENYLLSGEINQAIETKNKYINKSFYKYRCFDADGYWIDWVKGTLYANSPNSFNDPFDCMLTIAPETSEKLLRDELKDFLKQKGKLSKQDMNRLEFSSKPIEAFKVIYERYYGIKLKEDLSDKRIQERWKENIEKGQYDFKDNFRAICFSEKNDSILMWSHYANHHQGFCVEYNFEDYHEISERIYPVIYCEKRPILLPDDLKINNSSIRTILYKAPEWDYEQEWRYLQINPTTQHNDGKPMELIVPNAIKAIYLGAKANEDNPNLVKIKDMAKEFNIQLYKMRFDDNNYKLIPDRID